MQLVKLATPKGDKGKCKNKNCHSSSPSDSQVEHPDGMVGQESYNRCTHGSGNHLQVVDLMLPKAPGIQHGNMHHVDTYLMEHVLPSPTIACVNGLLSSTCSGDSAHGPSLTQLGSSETVPSSLLWQQYQQIHVDKNIYGEAAESQNKDCPSTEPTCSNYSGVVSSERISSESVCEAGDDDLFCGKNVSEKDSILEGKAGTLHSESNKQNVDENMNLTSAQDLNYLQHLPLFTCSESLSNSGSLIQVKGLSRATFILETGRDKISTAHNVLRELDQLSVIRSQEVRHQDTEFISTDSYVLPKESILEKNMDFVNSDLNNLNGTKWLEFPSQEIVTPVTWQTYPFYFWITTEPPLWTSLALKENALNHPEIVHAFPQSTSCHISETDFRPQRDSISSELQTEYMGSAPEEDCDSFTTCDTSGESDVPDNCVFQNCETDCVGNVPSHSLGGQSDEGNEENISESVDCDIGRYNISIALDDLDCVLSMLPSTQICNNIILNQMTDEEVAMVMYQHENGSDDDNDDDAEILAYTAADYIVDDTDVVRPINPVSCTLDHGGNEVSHFSCLLL